MESEEGQHDDGRRVNWAVCNMLISILNYSNRLEVREITALFLWTMKPQLTVLSGKNGAGTSKSKRKRKGIC